MTAVVQERCLVGLDKEKVHAVWCAAVQSASGKEVRVSSKLVAAAVRSLLNSPSSTSGLAARLSSACDSWYTPSHILQLVRRVFQGGIIDLDPCSNPQAQQVIQACRLLSSADDGLAPDTQWSGRVFVNPPFGSRRGSSLQAQFLAKAMHEHASAGATEVLLLLKAAVGY